MSAMGPQERPMRNTLDDRLRAFETLLGIPGGRIDDLNRRSARRVISEARAALAAGPADMIDTAELRETAAAIDRIARGQTEEGDLMRAAADELDSWRATRTATTTTTTTAEEATA